MNAAKNIEAEGLRLLMHPEDTGGVRASGGEGEGHLVPGPVTVSARIGRTTPRRNSDLHTQAMRDLDKAFEAFLAGHARHPRFKSKTRSAQSARVDSDRRHVGKVRAWSDDRLVLPKIGACAAAGVAVGVFRSKGKRGDSGGNSRLRDIGTGFRYGEDGDGWADDVHRSPRLNVIASKGRKLTGSSSFALPMRSHCPSWSSNASSVRSVGSTNHR